MQRSQKAKRQFASVRRKHGTITTIRQKRENAPHARAHRSAPIRLDSFRFRPRSSEPHPIPDISLHSPAHPIRAGHPEAGMDALGCRVWCVSIIRMPRSGMVVTQKNGARCHSKREGSDDGSGIQRRNGEEGNRYKEVLRAY